jgi:lysophospholipase L1-like esterase
MFRYVALGDSITAGYSASSPALAYPSRLVHGLCKRGTAAVGAVLAEPGWTSTDLDSAVFANSAAPLLGANVITIWVGGDNLVNAAFAIAGSGNMRSARTVMPAALRRYGTDVGTLIGHIRSVSKARIVLCTQYNPFPNSPMAVEAVGTLNAATEKIALSTKCSLAPVHEWFAGQEAFLIRGYRTGSIAGALRGNPAAHPNNRGHAVIADNLLPFLV